MYTWLTRQAPPADPVAVPTELTLEERTARALGDRLRGLRDASRLSQEEVALRAGLSRNHYQLLEAGWSNRVGQVPANPRLATLVALSEVLQVRVEDLVADIFHPPDDISVELTGGPGRDG